MMPTPLFVSSGDVLADRRYQHALDFRARGDVTAAADLLAQALELAPDFASAWFALGEMRAEGGDAASATAALTEALRADPTDRHGAALTLARLRGTAPEEMPPAYVQALFNQYAPRFDAALVEQLGYRGPQLLREAVAAHRGRVGRPMRFASVADLGCGTGLVGEAFKDTYKAIVGVDLSAGMIAQARRKALYADLVIGDMLTFLRGLAPRSVDLVIAADAFVYVGDLAPLCTAAARALSPNGLLAFTVETFAGDDVTLGEKLRYAHGRAHIDAVLAEAGFRAPAITATSTRTEGGVPVPGLMVVAST